MRRVLIWFVRVGSERPGLADLREVDIKVLELIVEALLEFCVPMDSAKILRTRALLIITQRHTDIHG